MAGAKITIDITDADGIATMNRLLARTADMTPAMQQIGEELYISTRARIESGGPSPSGVPWAPLSPVTIARKHINKDRILYYLGNLLTSIHPESGKHSVEVGSDKPYAAAQQFGMKKGYAGTGHYKTRAGSFPIPWGNIPPRPFLGLSADDKTKVIGILNRYLTAP